MLRLELSADADADLSDILNYSVTKFGWDVGQAYLSGLDETLALLCERPQIGTVHPDIDPPIRSHRYQQHRIFYDLADGVLTVVRVLHRAMDVQRRLD